MVTVDRADIDVESVLDELGVEVEERGEREFACRCPLHDDRHRSFSVNVETGAWICYAGCGEGSLVALVVQVLGVEFREAYRWLENEGTKTGSQELVTRKLEEATAEAEPRSRREYLYEHGNTYSYMLNRGFTTETLKKWDVGKDESKRAVVLPYRPEGELLGLIYRFVDIEIDPSYDNTSALPKKEHLFGWEHLPPAPERIVVVEGPLDAMWLDQCGVPTVAILGSGLSKHQAEKLVRRSRTVVLGFDTDQAGRQITIKALKLLGGRALIAEWPRKDPQECTVDQVVSALGSAVEGSIWLLRFQLGSSV